jgi:hypothetical protein
MKQDYFDLITEIRRKEYKTEAETTLYQYHKCLANISEILVIENKQEITSETAIMKIRKCLENLF